MVEFFSTEISAIEFSEKKYDAALVLAQHAKRADEIEEYRNADNVGPVHGVSIGLRIAVGNQVEESASNGRNLPGRPVGRAPIALVCPASGLL